MEDNEIIKYANILIKLKNDTSNFIEQKDNSIEKIEGLYVCYDKNKRYWLLRDIGDKLYITKKSRTHIIIDSYHKKYKSSPDDIINLNICLDKRINNYTFISDDIVKHIITKRMNNSDANASDLFNKIKKYLYPKGYKD